MTAETRAAVVKWTCLGWIAAASLTWVSGCQDRPAGGAVVTQAATTRTVYTREEFRKLVVGLTPDEVIAKVGRPYATQDSGSEPMWYYNGLARDPVSGKVDTFIQVIFKDGKVDRVNY